MVSEAMIGLLGIASAGSLGWAYNISTKVSALEQANDDFKEFMEQLLDVKFDAINYKFDSINSRLGRIERVLNHVEIE